LRRCPISVSRNAGGIVSIRGGIPVATEKETDKEEHPMKGPVTVEDLMTTAVVSVKPTHLLERAAEAMQVADIRHLPVVDERNRLIGILSSHDVVARRPIPPDELVAAAMTRKVRSVTPTTLAHQAAALMIEHKIGSLPVLSSDGALVGVLTATDFLELAESTLRVWAEAAADRDQEGLVIQ
jgi:CBS domain-containing protein